MDGVIAAAVLSVGFGALLTFTDGFRAGGQGRYGRLMSARRSPGALETEILAVLHEASGPLSPGEVRALLSDKGGGELSYSAVVTTLTRLHEKGVVTRERSGRAYRYAAPAAPSRLIAWRMRRLLDAEADHAPVLTHFISGLSAGDEELVRRLLLGDDESETR